jgi:hypothetical protein
LILVVKIHLAFNPSTPHPTGKKYNTRVLSRAQRLRVKEMIKEASDDNPLLLSMLTWFSRKFKATKDEIIVSTATILQDEATIFVRKPRLYREEYKSAILNWQSFLAEHEDETRWLTKAEVKAMLLAVDHKTIVAKVLAKRAKEEAGEATPVVSFKIEEDDDDDASTEEESGPEVKQKKTWNVFTETELSTFKQTRSGTRFRSAPLVDYDKEFEWALQESRIEAERLARKAQGRTGDENLRS